MHGVARYGESCTTHEWRLKGRTGVLTCPLILPSAITRLGALSNDHGTFGTVRGDATNTACYQSCLSDWWVDMPQYSGTESVVDTGIVSTTKINSSAMVVVPGGLTLLWCYWHPSIDGPLHYYYYVYPTKFL